MNVYNVTGLGLVLLAVYIFGVYVLTLVAGRRQR